MTPAKYHDKVSLNAAKQFAIIKGSLSKKTQMQKNGVFPKKILSTRKIAENFWL